MDVHKVDKNQNPLEGAKFVLSKNGSLKVADMNCDENGVPADTTDLIGLVRNADGDYVVATADANKKDIVYAIDAGYAIIKGLDDVNYYLYETKAPEGYNLLSQPVQFKINAEYEPDGSALRKAIPLSRLTRANLLPI